MLERGNECLLPSLPLLTGRQTISLPVMSRVNIEINFEEIITPSFPVTKTVTLSIPLNDCIDTETRGGTGRAMGEGTNCDATCDCTGKEQVIRKIMMASTWNIFSIFKALSFQVREMADL